MYCRQHVSRPQDDPPDAALRAIVTAFSASPALHAKAAIGLVGGVLGATDWLTGPGDDAAAVTVPERHTLAAGEALLPDFLVADPYGAGVAAVIANVNDIAAMGGRCYGIVDTIVGTEAVARQVLAGLRDAARAYDVPILGGHLTITDRPPGLSAFALGGADALLAARHVAPGQSLLLACATRGQMRADFPFFSAMDDRGDRVASDVAVLPELAEAGLCVAAKDVSMAGALGTLAMLLEPTGSGATVDLDRLPRPADVDLLAWLQAFPSYGFWLCVPTGEEERCAAAFHTRGLDCATVGTVDGSGLLRVGAGGSTVTVTDVARGVTHLSGR